MSVTIRFGAKAVAVDEESDYAYVSAGVSENHDGSGFVLIFQCGLDDPDEQEVALGMDTHCLLTANQGSGYGCVTELALLDGVLRVVVTEDARTPLGLEDTEVEAMLEVDNDAIERLREGLRRIMNYGRPAARPSILQI